jgi:hypothetical protein
MYVISNSDWLASSALITQVLLILAVGKADKIIKQQLGVDDRPPTVAVYFYNIYDQPYQHRNSY